MSTPRLPEYQTRRLLTGNRYWIPPALPAGHKNEEVLFSQRCKLHCFKDGEWKGRAKGQAKLLKHKTMGMIRFIVRNERTDKILANHFPVKDEYGCSKSEFNCNDKKAIVWASPDYADNEDDEGQMQQFGILFKTEEHGEKFQKLFENARTNNSNVTARYRLGLALERGDLNNVRELMNQVDTDINEFGCFECVEDFNMTPLYFALCSAVEGYHDVGRECWIEIIKTLLEHPKVDLNKRMGQMGRGAQTVFARDCDKTPFELALHFGSTDVVKLFLKREGSNVHAQRMNYLSMATGSSIPLKVMKVRLFPFIQQTLVQPAVVDCVHELVLTLLNRRPTLRTFRPMRYSTDYLQEIVSMLQKFMDQYGTLGDFDFDFIIKAIQDPFLLIVDDKRNFNEFKFVTLTI